MDFEKKTWVNVPDPNNLPDIPEGQDSLAVFDADNMNRIEDGIESTHNKINNGLSEAFDKIALANMANLVVQKITSSCTWTAPKAASQMFRVFCVGAGGGGGKSSSEAHGSNSYAYSGGGGGGGGYIEIADVNIPCGTDIEIICGAGGIAQTDGGSTTFGDIVTAAGGEAGASATGQICGNGGNGGAGGGGGGARTTIGTETDTSTICADSGGNGDKFGGGGGGGVIQSYDSESVYSGLFGVGGTSSGGGGGGTYKISPNDGVRFNGSWLSCLLTDILDYTGSKGSTVNFGYGGNGGNGGAGGGGSSYYGGSGGGGGYCGNGGASNRGETLRTAYGGGGGFFCDGGDGGTAYMNGNDAGGGGGFFCDGGASAGGDGGVLIMYIKED